MWGHTGVSREWIQDAMKTGIKREAGKVVLSLKGQIHVMS
jgi:hypothetical protein